MQEGEGIEITTMVEPNLVLSFLILSPTQKRGQRIIPIKVFSKDLMIPEVGRVTSVMHLINYEIKYL